MSQQRFRLIGKTDMDALRLTLTFLKLIQMPRHRIAREILVQRARVAEQNIRRKTGITV